MPHIAERVVVTCSAQDLAGLLTHQPASWLLPFLRIASHAADALSPEGTDLDTPQSQEQRLVDVALGSPEGNANVAGVVSFPLLWVAEGYRCMFVRLNARLTVRPLRRGAELELAGSYEPPPHEHDDAVERLLVHRAAHVAVRNLLTNLRIAVEEKAINEANA